MQTQLQYPHQIVTIDTYTKAEKKLVYIIYNYA